MIVGVDGVDDAVGRKSLGPSSYSIDGVDGDGR